MSSYVDSSTDFGHTGIVPGTVTPGQVLLRLREDRRRGSRLRAGRDSCTPRATRAPARREVTLGRTGG